MHERHSAGGQRYINLNDVEKEDSRGLRQT
jgi:hypothetical protein